MKCKRCGNEAIELAGGFCEDCRELLNLDGCGRPKKVEIILQKMCAFASEMKRIRKMFPELAREIDRCIFDAGQNHIRSCGHGTCECQMSFETFHARQNQAFGTVTI